MMTMLHSIQRHSSGLLIDGWRAHYIFINIIVMNYGDEHADKINEKRIISIFRWKKICETLHAWKMNHHYYHLIENNVILQNG